MFDINTWAEDLIKEVFLKHKSEHGFKLFYSPIRIHPELVIISYQPGGTRENYQQEDESHFNKGDFRLPKLNAYAETDYPMASSSRRLFDFEGGLEILKRSVVFPLIFFRAPNIKAWRNLARDRRLEMEEYCFVKVKEIIQKVQPKRVLVIGFSTYDHLKQKNILHPISREVPLLNRKSDGARLAVSMKCADYPVLALIHLSGARISLEEFAKLKEILKHWLYV